MRLYAFLVLATCALHARAAAVPKLDVSDLQKKLAAVAQEAAKKEILPLETPSTEQELTDKEIAVNEVQNNLKRGNIPVKVIVDAKPIEKLDDVSLDDGADIKRVEIDLKNPGPPQRQEHETQNAEHHDEPELNIKQSVNTAQESVKQGFEGVSQGIQDWISNNEQINNLQQGLQSLQDNFKEQLSKLNQTVQSYLPQVSNPSAEQTESTQTKGLESVEISLKSLESSFQNTVQTLTEGVQAYALLPPTLRQAAEGAAGSGTTSSGSEGAGSQNNIFVQYLQALQTTISQGFANVTTSIQNTLNANQSGNSGNNTFAGPGSFISGIGSGIQNIFAGQSTTAATQSDEAGSTTARPNWPILQGIQSSLQNIFNPSQSQQSGQNVQASPPSSPGPIAQALQNNPIVQAVGNFIQPNRPGAQQPATQAPAAAQPVESAQSAEPAKPIAEGNNAVPASDAVPSTEEKKPETIEGPIKQMIQNNPIVKGISGAVQRIQNIGNPEKPRDTLEGQAPGLEKGHYGYPAQGSHGLNTVDSNDSGSGQVAKSESVKPEAVLEAKEKQKTEAKTE